jgi:hypothetical protein
MSQSGRSDLSKALWRGIAGLALLLLGACGDHYIHVGERWAALDKLTAPADAIAVQVSGPRSGAVGDKVRFKVTPRDDGYLWVVQVDNQDQVSLLFPNEEESDNQVTGGRERIIPGDAYALVLDKPTGVHLLAFIVTSQDDGLAQVLPPRVRDALQNDAGASAAQQPMGVVLDRGLRWGWQKQVLNIE